VEQPRWLGQLSGKMPPTISWEDNSAMLTDWSKNRIRYHRHGHSLLNGGAADVNIAASLYLEYLESIGQSKLIDKYKLYSVVFDKDLSKRLSTDAKKLGPKLCPEWRFLVDLDRLGDYLPYLPIEEFVADIKDWVQRKPLHAWDGDEEKFYTVFKEEAYQAFFNSGVTPKRKISVDDFFNNGDIWATSGSGYEPDLPKPFVQDITKNAPIPIKKNKWGLRWTTSKYDLKRLMFKKRKQMCKAVQKSELTKLRAVISSDLSLYLKMSYISTFLDQIFSQRTDSTLWMNKEQTHNLWQSMAPDGTTRMPLDQSEFDKNVSYRQVEILLVLIEDILKAYDLGDEVLEIMSLIRYALEGGYVYGLGEKIEITNGILSGWRWTAMLDTMVNIVELRMAKRYCLEKEQPILGSESNSQGDDTWLKLQSYNDAFSLWYAYDSFGLVVNPKKFFVDTVRDEYLRRVMDKDVITGYPARSVASICFRNPIQPAEPPGPQRVRSNFSKWKLFAERGNVTIEHPWIMAQYTRDSRQGVIGMSDRDIKAWTYQDVQYGGIGLGHGTADILDLDERQPEYDRIDLQSLPGVSEWIKFAAPYKVEERSINAFVLSTMEFQPHYALPHWVKYVYTYDDHEYAVPSGLLTDQPGTVAIGPRTKRTAAFKGWRWYSDRSYLFSAKHMFSPSIGTVEHVVPLKPLKIWDGRIGGKSLPLPPLKEGITMTLAALSDDLSAVFQYVPDSCTHKPKRWLKDYYTGKLKAKISPVNGWGLDITGYVGNSLLNVAITYFLLTKRATMALWDSLLAEIDKFVKFQLDTMMIRVVE